MFWTPPLTFRGSMDPFEVFFWAFFLTFLVLNLHKGYLDQIGIEFNQKLIDAIVN